MKHCGVTTYFGHFCGGSVMYHDIAWSVELLVVLGVMVIAGVAIWRKEKKLDDKVRAKDRDIG